MRLKNLLIIGIMLIILTIGAVSAADDNSTSDALTLDEQTDEISVVEVEKIASDSSEVIGENGTFYPGGGNGTYHVNDTSRVAPNMSVNAPDISYGQTASVYTSLPGDATGSVEITFAGRTFSSVVINGLSSVQADGLEPGNYSVRAVYWGDENYLTAECYTSFSVLEESEMQAMNLTVIAPDSIAAGENLTVYVYVPHDATGTVYIGIGENWYNEMPINGVVAFFISGLEPGNYTMEIFASGDGKYLNATSYNYLSVLENKNSSGPADSYVIVEVEDITYGESALIHATLPYGATGSVDIILDGVMYTAQANSNSEVYFMVDRLNAGQYTVLVNYAGDANYRNSSATSSFRVNKKDAVLKINVRSEIYSDENQTFVISLSDGISGTVYFDAGNMSYGVDVADGEAVVEDSGFDAGTYQVTAYFMGNENYNSCNAAAKFTVLEKSLSNIVTQDNINSYFDENGILKDSITFDELIFEGEFAGNTVENLTLNRPIKITGNETVLTDLSFVVCADNVEIANVTSLRPLFIKNANNITVSDDMIISSANYGLYVDNVSYLTVANSYIDLSNDNGSSETYAIRVSGSADRLAENIKLINNVIVANMPSVELEWVNKGDNDFVLQIESAGVFFDYCDSVTFENNVINLTYSTSMGTYDTLYALYSQNCQNISITDNVIESRGHSYTYSVDLDNCNGFEVCENRLTASSQGYACLIDVQQSSNGVITSNNVVVYGESSAYGINTFNADSVDLYNNTINLYSYWAVGIELQSSNVAAIGNVINASGNYSNGIASFSNLTAKYNTVIINASNEGNKSIIYRVMGVETVGLKSLGSAVLENNTVINAVKSIDVGPDSVASHNTFDGESVFGNNSYVNDNRLADVTFSGDRTKLINNVIEGDVFMNGNDGSLSTNNITGTVTVNGSGNAIAFNHITSTSDYAIDLTDSADAYVSENTLYASQFKGNAAIRDNGLNNVSKNYPAGLEITVSASDIHVGDYAIISVNSSENIEGNVIISVTSSNRNYTDSYEFHSDNAHDFQVYNLDAGEYSVVAIYDNITSNRAVFNVLKLNSSVTAEYDGGMLSINLPGDALGNATVTVAGITYACTVFDGHGLLNLSFMLPGNYSAHIAYNGDNRYLPSSADLTFVVPRMDCDIFTAEYDGGIFSIILPGDASGNATVTVAGITYECTVFDGYGLLNLSFMLPGNYSAHVAYNGDNRYLPSSADLTFVVPRMECDIDAEADEVYVGDDVVIEVMLPQDATGIVSTQINGVTYEMMVMDGEAIITVSGLGLGNYTVSVEYSGDNIYMNSSAVLSFSVCNRESVSLIVTASDISVGETAFIHIFTSAPSVEVRVDNRSYIVEIDSNGTGVLGVEDLASGTYIVTARFNGDASHAGVMNQTAFNVFKLNPELAVNCEDGIIEVNLPADATGSVSVTYGDSSLTVPVLNGMVHVNASDLPAGNYSVHVTYSGDEKYLPANASNVLTIEEKQAESTLEINVSDIFVGESVFVRVSLTSDGIVNVRINGNNHTVNVKNGTGLLIVPGLGEGDYTVFASFEGNSQYLPATAQASFSVLRKSKSDAPIAAEASNVVYGESVVINVELPQNATGAVNVTLGNDSYSADVISGKVTFLIPGLEAGNYTVLVSYMGDELYNMNSTYVSFAVSKIQYLFDIADITVGENATVYVHASPAVTSNITVQIDNTYYEVISIADGEGSLIIQGLKAGNHIVRYANQTIEFNVNKKQTSMNLSFSDIHYGEDMVIEIILPEDANGDVFLKLNGNHTVSLADGKATVTVSGLEEGTYTGEIFYYNDEIYENISQNITFSVLPNEEYTLDFTVVNITYGDIEAIRINASKNITETVNVTLYIVPQSINSTSLPIIYSLDLTDGVGILEISNLNADSYSVEVKGIQKTFTVSPKDVTLTVDSIVYGEETVTLNLSEDMEGEIQITVNGVKYTAVIENKKATFNASGLDADTYELEAVYIGNNNYRLKETTYQFNIGKVNATFNLTVDSITYSNDETIEIDVGPGITGKVYIDIGDKSFYTYVNNRKAIFNITGVYAGNYVATLRYEGNNNTYSSRVIYNITVKQAEVNMSVHVGNLTYSKDNTIALNVPEGLTGNVTIIIGNRHYTQVIDNRVIIFHIDNFNAGNYIVTAIYEGNNNYYAKTVLYNITIEKMTVDFTADVREVSYREQTAMRVNVPEGVTGNVTVIIGNYTYDTIILDGVIEYYITNINAGNHEVRVIYRGNDNYYYNETVFNITVKKLDVDITLEQDKITYSKNNSFTLNIPEGVDGNIMVRIGNDTYNTVIYNGTATVNALNIKAGNYVLEAVYAGNNNYNNVTRFFNITIEKMHVGIELGVGSVSYNKNQTLNLIFPEEATGNVSIRIGNTTIKTTVINGNATFNVIGINAGNYRAEVRYEGNDYYNEETTFVNINIEKVDVGITLETPTIAYNDEKELTIDMSDIATGNVTVEIEGKKFTSIINNGKATFSIMGVTAGKHTVKVTYAGDVNHNSAQAIFNLTVTKLNALLNLSYDEKNIIVALPEDATGDVVAVIGNTSYAGAVENGSAIIEVDGLLPGDYTATVNYMGDANYNEGTSNVNFTVERISAPITVEAADIDEGETAVIVVTLPENALGTVTVNVAGRSYTVTVRDGKVTAEVSGLSAGNYTVSADYSGSEIYLPASNTTLLSVSKTFVEAGIAVNASDVSAGEDAVIAVTLPEDATGTVTVTLNNIEYTADVLNGKATVNLGDLNVGKYEATLSYSGDAKYLPDTKQVSFEVTKADALFNVSVEDVEFGEAAVIRATFPSDATGRAVLSIGGNTLTATIRNGVATFITSGLLPDTYTATVTYNGNAKYGSAVQTAEFTVFKLEPSIDMSAGDIEYGQDANIIVTLPDDATGYVNIIVSGSEYSAEIVDGIAELSIPSLKAGEYDVSAVYDGDEIYTPVSATAAFKVSKVNVTIDIIVSDVSAGENSKISIILPDDATGGLHYTAGGSTGYMSNFKGGKYVIEAVYGQAGTVSVRASYDGNDKYLPGEAEASFTVRPVPVSMQITADPVYAGETATITVTLPEDAVGSISVSYPGGSRGSNVNNGKFSFTTSFANAGNYTISASFKSLGKYESVENSTVLVVSVKPVEPAMEITANDVKEGSDEVISVALPRDATGEVTLDVKGVKYVAPVKDGQATFTLSDLGEGEYNATVTYAGDAKYGKAVKTASFTVKKDTIGTVIVMESKFTRYATDYSGGERGGEFSATLYDVDQNPLSGKNVQITVNGVIYNVTSDENGKVGLTVNLAAANTYTYALLFYGDEDYKASPIASSKLTVIKKPVEIIANDMAFKTSAKTKTVKVALNTIRNPFDGKMYLKEGKKLELKVDGKTYTAKTDKDGVAKFNIKISKKGKYTATISFEGSVTYESATKKIKITVSKSPSKNKELKGVGSGIAPKNLNTGGEMNIEGNYSEYLENGNVSTSEISTDKKDAVIDVDSKFTRLATDYGAGERGGYFYARLVDSDGNPIAGKTVQISVNGPVYEVVTDSQGRAGLQVNLAAANTYTYALSFSGDDEYNPAQIASSKLTVTKKATFITAKSVSFKAKAKTKTVSVSLKTVNNPFDGKMYLKTGKKLTLKVKGKTYTAKINKNHVAKFSIKLTKKGKYTAKISFDGDATYEACSNSVKINIK